MSKVYFPSDFPQLEALPSSGLLAGRILTVEGDAFTLADASHQVRLVGRMESPLVAGDLVAVRYERDPSGLRALSVESRQVPGSPTRDGEFSRLHGERGGALKARSLAARVIREYFDEQSFVEVQTPTFVPSPGLDPHVHSLAPVVRKNRTDYLITSPEFHMKRLLVGGMPRIYQFARCFRAEEQGAIHEPEFTLLEWYRAFADYGILLDDTEEILTRVFTACSPSRPAFERPFRRLTVLDAFSRFAPEFEPLKLLSESPPQYFQAFVDLVDPGIAALPGPTFLIEFPLDLAGLARPCPHDPRFAERFELYLDGVELCNGYGELTDPDEQRARFQAELERRRAAAEPLYPIDEKFLQALKEGLPPSSGNALGLDRLVALAIGLSTIGPTLAFTDEER